MSATGWTPVDENAAKWTPIDETAPVQKEGFLQSLGGTLSGLLHPSAQNPYPGMGIEAKQAAAQASAEADAARKAAGYSGAYRIAAPIAQSVGADVPGMEQAAAVGDTSGVLGHAVGSAIPAVAGVALHAGGKAVGEALPSATKAGAALQDIKATAGNVPINMSKPGATALELYTQSQRGATLPKAVRDLVNRATKPDAPPITYAEAKDFQSNISRLSANERMNLTPATGRLVGQLNQDLKGALSEAADTAGKGEQFTKAMKEYHDAMKIQGWTEAAKQNAWKIALTGALGYELKKLLGL